MVGERYELVSVVGEGGMGSVWAARHLITQQLLALKLFHSVADVGRTDARRRFLREARTSAILQHPHVVTVIDAFETRDGTLVLAMELLNGETLAQLLHREGALGLERTASLLLPVVSALGAAHALGIVHRDVKPANIFLSDAGDEPTFVRVLDFGIAKWPKAKTSGTHTESQVMLGTTAYMSPEQATLDRAIDHRADIWAFGVVLYECLSGRRPLPSQSIGQLVAALLERGIDPLEQHVTNLPSDVTQLVRSCLERDPERRLSSLEPCRLLLSRYTNVNVLGVPVPQPPVGEARSLDLIAAPDAETARVARRLPPDGGFEATTRATYSVSMPPPRAVGAAKQTLIVLGGLLVFAALATVSWFRHASGFAARPAAARVSPAKPSSDQDTRPAPLLSEPPVATPASRALSLATPERKRPPAKVTVSSSTSRPLASSSAKPDVSALVNTRPRGIAEEPPF